MSTEVIKWKDNKLTNFTGRNGYFKCSGIEVMEISEENIMLSPITGKGEVGRSDISIPKTEIPALIRSLVKINEEK